MARGSRSEKIREYKTANPTATAAEIQEALKKERIKVSMPLIYNVLGAKKKKRRKAVRSKASSNGEQIAINSLLEAKKLVASLGSVEEAQRALDALVRLNK